eukprot:TRINITY_DN27762_c0_g1_i2.p1 TRINITY_DN27762_c0_g1~~TRINITY_DN27762_c0_g1_i2.p1  ORF type:complete len:586 (+),score=139.83 TRINITY_DN27762_c0_g1_i2:233-1990(+)
MPAATLVPTVVVAPAAPLTSPPTVSPTPVQSLPAMADQENVKEGPAGGAGTALERAYCIPFTQFKLSKTPPKKGGGGTVLLATWTGKKVALKTTNNSSSFFFEKELELLCKLSHPNIVRLFGWSQNESLNYIVTEWIPKGNLLEVVCDPNISFDWPLALAFMHDILSGLEYLHSCNVVHRDLKPENILVLSLQSNDDIFCKITDFGISRNISDTSVYTASIGTPGYQAPEQNTTQYNQLVDIFAFGFILWSILTRREPWLGEFPEQRLLKIKQGNLPKLPKQCPTEMEVILSFCWQMDPEKRPTAAFLREKVEFVQEICDHFPPFHTHLQQLELGTELFKAIRESPPLGSSKITMHMNEGIAILAFWVEETLILTRKIREITTKKENNEEELRILFAPREVFSALKAGKHTSKFLQILSIDMLSTTNEQMTVQVVVSNFHWVDFKPQGNVTLFYKVLDDEFEVDFGNMCMDNSAQPIKITSKLYPTALILPQFSNPTSLPTQTSQPLPLPSSLPPTLSPKHPPELQQALVSQLLVAVQTADFESLKELKGQLLAVMTEEELTRLVTPFASSPMVLQMFQNFLKTK